MWICCQLGAREHYSIPHALHGTGQLELLITDAWASTLLPWKLVPLSRQAERIHPGIPSRLVASFDWSLLLFELAARRKLSGWQLTMARNEWFQRNALAKLQAIHRRHPDHSFTLFSYSYTALQVFRFANEVGWRTVLGQIDPGPVEERIVSRLHRDSGRPENDRPAPADYWREWRQECELADRIVVNSEWSRQALRTEGVPENKLAVVPLVFEAPDEARTFARTYPHAFDVRRPLRILFLGQINLRKGAGEIFRAIPMLKDLPVEFWMVGPVQIPIPAICQQNLRVKWFGPVLRGAAMGYYRDADVFLFPTFSDGFGLTQLEAQAWNLPLIASPHCGEVVRPLENGFVLREVAAEAIVEIVRQVLAQPQRLAQFSRQSRSAQFMPGHLAAALMEAGGALTNV